MLGYALSAAPVKSAAKNKPGEHGAGTAAPVQGPSDTVPRLQNGAVCHSHRVPQHAPKRRHKTHTERCSQAFPLLHFQVIPAANCKRNQGMNLKVLFLLL